MRFPMVRPLALGYLRLWAADPPEAAAGLTAEVRSYADKEGLTLGEVYTDRFDLPTDGPGRPAFGALMDAVRRCDPEAVIIPGPGPPVPAPAAVRSPAHHHRGRGRRQTSHHPPRTRPAMTRATHLVAAR